MARTLYLVKRVDNFFELKSILPIPQSVDDQSLPPSKCSRVPQGDMVQECAQEFSEVSSNALRLCEVSPYLLVILAYFGLFAFGMTIPLTDAAKAGEVQCALSDHPICLPSLCLSIPALSLIRPNTKAESPQLTTR